MGVRTPICDIAMFILQGPVLSSYRDALRFRAAVLKLTGFLQLDPDPIPNPENLRRMHGVILGPPSHVRAFVEYAESIHNEAYRHNRAGRKIQMVVDYREDVDECLQAQFSGGLTGLELR